MLGWPTDRFRHRGRYSYRRPSKLIVLGATAISYGLFLVIFLSICLYKIKNLPTFNTTLVTANKSRLDKGVSIKLTMRGRQLINNESDAIEELTMLAKIKEEEYNEPKLSESDIALGTGNLEQDDHRLVAYIRSEYMMPPSPKGVAAGVDWKPIHVTNKNIQQAVSRFIRDIFNGIPNGTFIECGANDGEFFSNTMILERDYGWTGLLIESDERPLRKLLVRNRAAWIAKCCLSITSQPKKMEFLRHGMDEGLSFIPGKRHFIGDSQDYFPFNAQCFPLYSILSAINLTTVDYFSLDIEGAELDVLKTVPWDRVLIKVLSVEVHPDYVKPMREYMTSEVPGYKMIRYIDNGYSHDQIYAHKSILHELSIHVD